MSSNNTGSIDLNTSTSSGLLADQITTEGALAYGLSSFEGIGKFSSSISTEIVSTFSNDLLSTDPPPLFMESNPQKNGLNGETGKDVLTGLDSNDVFAFALNSSNDVITNFGGVEGSGHGESKLLREADILKFEDAGSASENIMLSHDDQDRLISLEGVQNVQVSLKNFDFTDLDNLPENQKSKIINEGETVVETGQALNHEVESNLETIANSLNNSATFDYNSIASALWNSGHSIDARKLADSLWNEGADQQQIGQAMKYSELSSETIADAVKRGIATGDGTGLDDIDVAASEISRLESEDETAEFTLDGQKVLAEKAEASLPVVRIRTVDGYTEEKTRDQIQDSGRAEVIRTGNLSEDLVVNYSLEGTAENGIDFKELSGFVVIKAGKSSAFIDVEPLSDYEEESIEYTVVKLADGKDYDLGKSQQSDIILRNIDPYELVSFWLEKGTALESIVPGLIVQGFDLSEAAHALKFGSGNGTGLTNIEIGSALWKGWLRIDYLSHAFNQGVDNTFNKERAIKFANALKNISSNSREILEVLVKEAGFNLKTAGYALFDTENQIITKDGQQVLRKIEDKEFRKELIRDVGFWLSFYDSTGNLRLSSNILWEAGFSTLEIAETYSSLGRSFSEIADGLRNGISIKYKETEGNTQTQVIPLTYVTIAKGFWSTTVKEIGTGEFINSTKLADLLWDIKDNTDIFSKITGISKALNFVAGLNKRQMVDHLYRLIENKKNYLNLDLNNSIKSFSIGVGLAASEIKDFSRQDIAQFVWDRTSNVGTVASVLMGTAYSDVPALPSDAFINNGETRIRAIAKFIKEIKLANGQKLDYVDVALGLLDSNFVDVTSSRVEAARLLGDILWDIGASTKDIAGVLRDDAVDERFPLFTTDNINVLADVLKSGITNTTKIDPKTGSPIQEAKLNYITVTQSLWDSGFGTNIAEIAIILRNLGANEVDIAQSLYKGTTEKSLYQIAHFGIARAYKNIKGTQEYFNKLVNGLSKSGLNVSLKEIAEFGIDTVPEKDDREKSRLLVKAFWTSDIWAKKPQEVREHKLINIMDSLSGLVHIDDLARAVWNNKNELYRDLGKTGLAARLLSLGYGPEETAQALWRSTGINPTQARSIVGTEAVKISFQKLERFIEPTLNKFDSWTSQYNPYGKFGIVSAAKMAWEGATDAGKALIDEAKNIKPQDLIDLAKRIPVVGSAVSAIESAYLAYKEGDKGLIKGGINTALAWYGGTNVFTPKLIDFTVDFLFEVKSGFENALTNSVIGIIAKSDRDFVKATVEALKGESVEAGLKKIINSTGFNGAWDPRIVDVVFALNSDNSNGKAFKLMSDDASVDNLVNVAIALKTGDLNLLNPSLRNNQWINDLRDNNLSNDREALRTGVRELGFTTDVDRWTNVISSIRSGKNIEAVLEIGALQQLKGFQDWRPLLEGIQNDDYTQVFSTVFKAANYSKGETLANVASALKDKDYSEAFYGLLTLSEPGDTFKDAMRDLKNGNYASFAVNAVKSAAALIKVL